MLDQCNRLHKIHRFIITDCNSKVPHENENGEEFQQETTFDTTVNRPIVQIQRNDTAVEEEEQAASQWRVSIQDAASREFINESATDYCCYSDDLFSVRVSVTLNQYRSSGSVKESTIEQSLFFEKQANGKWMCYAMTAVDVSKPVE